MGIIIYGAGREGKKFYDFIEFLNLSNQIQCFVDRNYNQQKKYKDKEILSPSTLKAGDKIIIGSTLFSDEIEHEARKKECIILPREYFSKVYPGGVTKYNRNYCAFYHIDGMNKYFEDAESDVALSIFWDETSPAYSLFKKLNLDNVIELACGRGRHVHKYIDLSEKICLVDILEKNIELCKTRFLDYDKITYYKNNGYDLRDLASNTYSAIFSYDAMVHFELLDIYSYISDMFRVLRPGGMALIHHSNLARDYRQRYGNAPHGRNFMTEKLFAYLAFHSGFEIVEQKVIDWGYGEFLVKDLDCLSLIRKPLV